MQELSSIANTIFRGFDSSSVSADPVVGAVRFFFVAIFRNVSTALSFDVSWHVVHRGHVVLLAPHVLEKLDAAVSPYQQESVDSNLLSSSMVLCAYYGLSSFKQFHQ